jgi:hypothetical protein
MKKNKNMKAVKSIVLGLISLFIIVQFSCEKEKLPGTLEVFVKADGARMGNITVKLYRSEDGRTNDSLYLFEVTPSSNFETEGAKFPNLEPQTYYMKVKFSDGLNNYEGDGQIYVPYNETTTYEIVCEKSATGNLKVFIRKDTPSGVYMGGKNVSLYATKADRDAETNVLQVSATPTTNPQIDGAVFDYLPFARYYLRSNFVDSSKDYEGKGDVLVPINTTTSYHLVCTEK